jgi:hypothetical protein
MVFTSQLTGGNHMPNRQEDKPLKGKKLERRNGHAFHPIMSKGGVHEKAEKAKRKAAKHEMNRMVNEWLGLQGGSTATPLTSLNKIVANNPSSPRRPKRIYINKSVF